MKQKEFTIQHNPSNCPATRLFNKLAFYLTIAGLVILAVDFAYAVLTLPYTAFPIVFSLILFYISFKIYNE